MPSCFFGELLRIYPLFEAARIPVIPYKGPVLAWLAYGSVVGRVYEDLDFAVQQQYIPDAVALLKAAGYRAQFDSREAHAGQGGIAPGQYLFNLSGHELTCGTAYRAHPSLFSHSSGLSRFDPENHPRGYFRVVHAHIFDGRHAGDAVRPWREAFLGAHLLGSGYRKIDHRSTGGLEAVAGDRPKNEFNTSTPAGAFLGPRSARGSASGICLAKDSRGWDGRKIGGEGVRTICGHFRSQRRSVASGGVSFAFARPDRARTAPHAAPGDNPTESDREAMHLPDFLSPLYLLLRPWRLAREYGLGLKHRLKPDLAVYQPTPLEIVDLMLQMADIVPGDVLNDLGCGDGRIVVEAAEKYGIHAEGVDINPKRIAEARARRASMESNTWFSFTRPMPSSLTFPMPRS